MQQQQQHIIIKEQTNNNKYKITKIKSLENYPSIFVITFNEPVNIAGFVFKTPQKNTTYEIFEITENGKLFLAKNELNAEQKNLSITTKDNKKLELPAYIHLGITAPKEAIFASSGERCEIRFDKEIDAFEFIVIDE